ncbi:hypothetical protein U1Q18_014054 [Sarracenia purpurea var. burkii]
MLLQWKCESWNIALAKGAYSVQIVAVEILSYGLDGLSKVRHRVRVEGRRGFSRVWPYPLASKRSLQLCLLLGVWAEPLGGLGEGLSTS